MRENKHRLYNISSGVDGGAYWCHLVNADTCHMSQLPHHFIKVVNLLGSELELYKKFLVVILEMLDILVVATSGPCQAGVVGLS